MPDVLCSICYDSLVQEVDDVLVTECGHLFHQKCLTKWRSDKCAECRTKIYVPAIKKVFLIGFESDASTAPISGDILMTTNTNLLNQLTENATEIEHLVAACSVLELQKCSIQKDCDYKKAKILSMEKVMAARYKTISSKERNIRALQLQLKDLKLENSALKKSNNDITKQLKDRNSLDAKMKHILAENQQLQRLLDTKTKPMHNRYGAGNPRKVANE